MVKKSKTTSYPGSSVEMGHLDAESFLREGARSPAPGEGLSQSALLENMTPIAPPSKKQYVDTAPVRDKDKKKEEEDNRPVTLEEKDPRSPLEKVVRPKLLDRLAQKYNVLSAQEQYKTGTVEPGGIKSKVTLRKPEYEYTMWALGEMEARVESKRNLASLRGTQSRTTFLKHLKQCMCVVAIDDDSVIDVVCLRDSIKEALPDWDGKYESLPEIYQGVVASNLFDVLPLMHEGWPFELEDLVSTLYPGSLVEIDDKEDATDEELEDPSPAA